MTINNACVLYVEHGEGTVNVADAGDAGRVHPFIESLEMSPMHQM